MLEKDLCHRIFTPLVSHNLKPLVSHNLKPPYLVFILVVGIGPIFQNRSLAIFQMQLLILNQFYLIEYFEM